MLLLPTVILAHHQLITTWSKILKPRPKPVIIV